MGDIVMTFYSTDYPSYLPYIFRKYTTDEHGNPVAIVHNINAPYTRYPVHADAVEAFDESSILKAINTQKHTSETNKAIYRSNTSIAINMDKGLVGKPKLWYSCLFLLMVIVKPLFKE